MMKESVREREPEGAQADYPLRRTAVMLNQRMGLYLSEEQQRGLATGLLVGAVAGGAIVAWSIMTSLRGR